MLGLVEHAAEVPGAVVGILDRDVLGIGYGRVSRCVCCRVVRSSIAFLYT